MSRYDSYINGVRSRIPVDCDECAGTGEDYDGSRCPCCRGQGMIYVPDHDDHDDFQKIEKTH